MSTTKTHPAIYTERLEEQCFVLGVPGRMTTRSTRTPELWLHQRWVSRPRPIAGWGAEAALTVEIRFDDDCNNGHNTFAITAEIRRPRARDIEAGGCLHDEIAKVFPGLAPLIPWHLRSSDGPLHYIANTVYHAGDRDHNGLRKGERRGNVTRAGLRMWELVAINAPGVRISDTPTGKPYHDAETCPLFLLDTRASGETAPIAPALEWRQSFTVGEGKARDLAAARSCAVWPEATDEELSAEPEVLRAALQARAAGLHANFRAAIEAAGFAWSPADYEKAGGR